MTENTGGQTHTKDKRAKKDGERKQGQNQPHRQDESKKNERQDKHNDDRDTGQNR